MGTVDTGAPAEGHVTPDVASTESVIAGLRQELRNAYYAVGTAFGLLAVGEGVAGAIELSSDQSRPGSVVIKSIAACALAAGSIITLNRGRQVKEGK